MYAKVFASLWNGSLRGRRDAQLVFVYLLANCDDEGTVEIIRDKIGDDTGVKDGLHEAIALLESPDADSRSPAEEGRRIVPLFEGRNWGWRIVNYEHYRKLRNELERKEQNRRAQAKHRQQTSALVSKRQPGSALSAQEEAEEEAEEKTKAPTPLARAFTRAARCKDSAEGVE